MPKGAAMFSTLHFLSLIWPSRENIPPLQKLNRGPWFVANQAVTGSLFLLQMDTETYSQ